MKKINVKDFIILVMFNLILFQVPLMYYVSDIFNYIDEFVAVIAVVNLLLFAKHSYDLFTIKYIFILFIYSISTIFANYSAGIVTEFSIIFKGMILFLRNFLILISIYNLGFKTKSRIVKLIPIFVIEVKILLLCALLFLPINYAFDTSMTYDVRFGIKSYSFIFHHPGNFATYLWFMLILLTYSSEKSKFIFSNKFYKGLTIFLLCTTLRYSFMIAIGIYIFYRILKSHKICKEIKFMICVGLLVIVLIIVFPQISKYFLQGDTPRLLFYKYALITFEEYPLGTGFSTFGSYMAQVNYSPLYYKYGFNQYYGMTESNPLFLFDNFWPMIITESGIIGTICIIVWFVFMLRQARKKNSLQTKIIILFFLVFSIVGQTVVHFSSVIFYILMGIALSPDYKKLMNKEC